MKNQNDLIAMIVCFVLTIIVVVLCFTVFKRQEVAPSPPAVVATAPAVLPKASPVMAASLPKGGDKSGGPGGLPGFGGPGGAPIDTGKINASGTTMAPSGKKMLQVASKGT